jgi:hypothetical protein
MNSATRYNFIKQFAKIGMKGKALKAIPNIPVSKSEIKEESKQIIGENNDESILDEGANTTLISPWMARIEDLPVGHARLVDESILSRSERIRLAAEVNALRCATRPSYNPAFWLAIIPQEA